MGDVMTSGNGLVEDAGHLIQYDAPAVLLVELRRALLR